MIKVFVFNHFEVNCTLAFDSTTECVLIDVCSQSQSERKELIDFIEENDLKVKHILITHAHIDHVCDAYWATKTFNLPLKLHKDGERFIRIADAQAEMMGFNVDGIENISLQYITKEDVIEYGNSCLKVFETPGHCAGSLCFYNKEEDYVVTGDVLFRDSIGRTDLPTGDFETLMSSIKNNLFILPENTKCICGHGPSTEIGYEKENNPFIS